MRIVLLAALLVIAACDSQPPKTAVDINPIIRLADHAIQVTQKISAGAPAADVHAAMEQMGYALTAARKQIDAVARRISVGKYLGRGSIEPRELGTCLYPVVDYASMLERMPIEMRGPWLMQAAECGSKATTYFEAVSGEDAAAAALAISVIAPIMLVAEAQFGIGAESALENYRSRSQAIVAKLVAECGAHSSGTEGLSLECAAYEVARSVEPKLATFAAELPTPLRVQ
jgi:hypothetical protein